MIRHLILFICFLSGFSDLFAQNVWILNFTDSQ